LRVGVGGGGENTDFAGDPLDRSVRVKERLLVSDPNGAIAAVAQPFFALAVSGDVAIQPVNSAIDLDHRPMLVADEIYDVRAK
jgi:hypothetical protein